MTEEKEKKITVSDIANNIKGRKKPSESMRENLKKEKPKKKESKGQSGWSQAKEALLVAGVPTLVGALLGGRDGAAIGAQEGAKAYSGYQGQKIEARERAEDRSRADRKESFNRELALTKLDQQDQDNKLRAGIMEANMQKDAQTLDLQRQRLEESRRQNVRENSFRNRKLRADQQLSKEKRTRDLEEKAKQQELKERSLIVPNLGKAYTKEDAKALKSAAEMKSKFDRQIGELIDLRKSKGAEFLDREAVGRGKQLSKDLLLTYKNLAKLGVLSKSDEDIINAIIPGDPLEFNMSSIVGQDPTLVQLEKFRGDLEDDYSTTVRTRLQGGDEVASKFTKSAETQAPNLTGGGLGIDSAQASQKAQSLMAKKKELEMLRAKARGGR